MGRNSVSLEIKRVCIIGGGPSGLVTLRRILETSSLTGVIYEQKDDIGGLWNYKGEKKFATSSANLRDDISSYPDPENITAMYDNLRTNAPVVAQQFQGYSYKDGMHNESTFATQQEYFNYMKGYAKHFNLLPNIQVNTTVIDVYPENQDAPAGEPGRWIVKTHLHQTDTYKTEIFDSVVVCIGSHTYPYYPKIEGLENFKGKLMHSKFFKTNEEFKGQNVVCIGLGPSSVDLALILAKTVKKVTVCHRFPDGYKLGLLPPNATETKSVKFIKDDGVITENDEFIPCDTIIFCTGYGRKFPFFKSYDGIKVRSEKYVCDMYNMTFFSKRPTLAFVNLTYRSVELVLVELQARYIAACFDGKIKLPSFQEMQSKIAAEEEAKAKENIPVLLWCQIGPFGKGFWDYYQPIVEQLGLQNECKFFELMKELYPIILSRLLGSAAMYKQDRFRIVDENTWEVEYSTSPEFPEVKGERITLQLKPDGTVTVDRIDI